MRIKICGITSPDDALAAVEAGADAIGINLVAGPRRVSVDQARGILSSLPPIITPIVLVRIEFDCLADEILELLAECWIPDIQVYGDITSSGFLNLGLQGFRVIPVVPVRCEAFADATYPWRSGDLTAPPRAVILDAFDTNREGGTGTVFCWDWVACAREAGKLEDWPSLILAGGLNPGNVAAAIRTVRPYAVDVSSGVESRQGKKDPARMRAFVEAVREVESEVS